MQSDLWALVQIVSSRLLHAIEVLFYLLFYLLFHLLFHLLSYLLFYLLFHAEKYLN
jgi:hypothetical protein